MPIFAQLFILIIIALIFIPYFIREKIRKDKKLGRPFTDFGDYSLLIKTALAGVLLIIMMTIITSVPRFDDPMEQVKYGELRDRPGLVEDAYTKLLEKHPGNTDYHFAMITAHFKGMRDGFNNDEYIGYRSTNRIHNFYYAMTKSEDPAKADLGWIMLSVKDFMEENYQYAYNNLQKVNNEDHKYRNYMLGELYFGQDRKKAEHYYRKEIENRGYVKGAYEKLGWLHFYYHEPEKLSSLVHEPEAPLYVDRQLKQIVSYRENDFKNYYRYEWERLFTKANWPGAAGALLITIVWLAYLIRINIPGKTRWAALLTTFLLGALFAVPTTTIITDFIRITVGFDLNDNPLNDFMYSVIGIGLVEELVKFLPVLLILWCSKAVKEPVDYIIYASVSALGFAFTENLLYLKSSQLDIIHTRGFWTAVSHMFDSSVIAYGLVLAKFRYKKSLVLYFFMFYGLAALGHGFYDFWLISEPVKGMWFITLAFTLSTILMYTSFINNALNHSYTSAENVNFNMNRQAVFITSALIGITIFEYIVLSIIYGPITGNFSLISALFSSSYIIFFLSVRLSNIDIVRNEWGKIEFFEIVPYYLITGRKANQNQVVGKKFTFTSFRRKGPLLNCLPVTGEVVKREKISGFNGWFLVKLEQPITLGRQQHDHIYISTKERSDSLENDSNQLVHFMLIPNKDILDQENKKKEQLTFVDWAVAN